MPGRSGCQLSQLTPWGEIQSENSRPVHAGSSLAVRQWPETVAGFTAPRTTTFSVVFRACLFVSSWTRLLSSWTCSLLLRSPSAFSQHHWRDVVLQSAGVAGRLDLGSLQGQPRHDAAGRRGFVTAQPGFASLCILTETGRLQDVVLLVCRTGACRCLQASFQKFVLSSLSDGGVSAALQLPNPSLPRQLQHALTVLPKPVLFRQLWRQLWHLCNVSLPGFSRGSKSVLCQLFRGQLLLQC